MSHVQMEIDFRRIDQENNIPFHEAKQKLAESRSIPFYVAQPVVYQPKSEYFTPFLQLMQVLQAYWENPLASLSCSKTMLLPHQVEAAMAVLQNAKSRMLIADEVGLGKTIEAGLILKELMLKNNYDRALICVPSPLVYQWQNELKEKLNEHFAVLTGKVFKKNPNFLLENPKVIVSIDLAKMPDKTELFLQQKYDIVVFDEAHRLRRDQNKITQAYHFADKICQHCLNEDGALLLLSATPFRGKLEEIYYLIRLIDPDLLGPLDEFLKQYGEDGNGNLKEVLAPVVIRRRKKDVGGFTERFAKTVKVTQTPAEANFYDLVTHYVLDEYNRALSKGNHLKSFVMLVYQKILDSSRYALLQALQRRELALKTLLKNTQDKVQEISYQYKIHKKLFTEEEWQTELEDLYENEEFIHEQEEVADPEEIKAEIKLIQNLINVGSALEKDSKLQVLKKSIRDLKKAGHEKIILFTQFTGTLRYLQQELKKQYRVVIFHGGMTAQEKEKAVETFFQDAEIFIATEAGGEGRNLQIASALINYDLPWSPLKLEQRIGRIHRYGQKRDVFIMNFATRDTVAEKVIDVLDKKIKIFENAFGESDTLLGML
ncbi:MAG: DEAD/DEAH box helicase, partial [Candidatus Hydrogenedentota bacterium]